MELYLQLKKKKLSIPVVTLTAASVLTPYILAGGSCFNTVTLFFLYIYIYKELFVFTNNLLNCKSEAFCF